MDRRGKGREGRGGEGPLTKISGSAPAAPRLYNTLFVDSCVRSLHSWTEIAPVCSQTKHRCRGKMAPVETETCANQTDSMSQRYVHVDLLPSKDRKPPSTTVDVQQSGINEKDKGGKKPSRFCILEEMLWSIATDSLIRCMAFSADC